MERNPAFSGGDTAKDAIDVEAAVKAGSISAEEGLRLLQSQLELHKEATAAALATLESKIEAPLHTAVQSIVARMTEAPSNFQCDLTCPIQHSCQPLEPAHLSLLTADGLPSLMPCAFPNAAKPPSSSRLQLRRKMQR